MHMPIATLISGLIICIFACCLIWMFFHARNLCRRADAKHSKTTSIRLQTTDALVLFRGSWNHDSWDSAQTSPCKQNHFIALFDQIHSHPLVKRLTGWLLHPSTTYFGTKQHPKIPTVDGNRRESVQIFGNLLSEASSITVRLQAKLQMR